MFRCALRSPVDVWSLRCRCIVAALAVGIGGAWSVLPLRGQSAPEGDVTPTLTIAPGPETAPAPVAATEPDEATAAGAATEPAAAGIEPAAVTAPAAATAPVELIPPPSDVGLVPVPEPAPPAAVAAVTKPFVGMVTGDRVYVRSGPDTKYYEIGQLMRGDLVYVVGERKGWYQILPPNGSFCLVAKEFVALEAGGRSGTLTGNNVNVRAGSAIYKESDYAVLPPPLKKGAKVNVLGVTDKYYQIAPPETAYFFITADFVRAAPAIEYRVAQLRLPAGVTGPSGTTVETPTTLPTEVVIVEPPDGAPAGGTATEPGFPAPVPRVTYSETALARYNEANSKYQEEARKAVAEQNLDGLLAEFKAILEMENIAPSVKAGCQANMTAIERTLIVQRLIKEQAAASEATKAQREALRQQYEAAEKALAASKEARPYNAEGVLQTSTIMAGKYALVDPKTQRVVVYIDPSSASVDMGVLVGQYIGVRGVSKRMDDTNAIIIEVSDATLRPAPD